MNGVVLLFTSLVALVVGAFIWRCEAASWPRYQQQWQQQYQGGRGSRPGLLMNDHRVEVGVIRRLLRQRDNTPIELAE